MRDLADELLQTKVKTQLFGGDHAVRLGRLVLLDKLGSGAMGTVFAAHDPKLDRKVAVKVLHSSRASLLDEARALAKLAHPNVVAVHDVVEHEGGVHVIMELVPGTSLRRWLETQPPQRAILRVLREAGAGIAAAHHAGLVHRDIKPDNILVGDDRTRVVDFGLAATSSDGASAGTPSYMAPEVLAGQPATPASDQFSFAVTLHEALHGERPFAGKTRDELLTATSATPRFSSQLPSRVRAALSRALSSDPASRFPSMDALLAALRENRRRPVIAIAALALIAGGTAGALAFRSHAPDPCAVPPRAWTAELASRIHANLGSAQWASATLTRFSDTADRWQTTFVSVCRDHTVSDTLHDLRLRCLDRSLDRLSALATTLAEPADAASRPPPAVSRQPSTASRRPPADTATAAVAFAVADLPDPTLCSSLTDAGDLTLPSDRTQRSRALAIEHDIDRGWALFSLARYDRARDLAATTASALASLDSPGTRAQQLALEAAIAARTSSGDAARAKLQEALAAAAAVHAPQLELDLWSRTLRGELFAGDPKRVLEWAPFARAAAAGAGRQGAELDGIIGEAERAAGHLAQAKQLLEHALASTDPLRPDQRAVLELNLAAVQLAAGDSLAARTTLERALARVQATLGPDHPELALYLDKLAEAHTARGEIREALALHDRSLALRTHAFGDHDRSVATSLYHRGLTLLEAGELTRALRDLESASAIRRQVYGEDSSRLGEVVLALADLSTAKGVSAPGLYERAAHLDPRLDLVAHAPPASMATSQIAPLAADELLSVERARDLALLTRQLGKADAATLARALQSRLPADADAALAVPIGQALLAVSDRDGAATVFTAAFASAGSQPTRTALAAAIGLARSASGESAKQAARVAISLFQAMPELSRDADYPDMLALSR